MTYSRNRFSIGICFIALISCAGCASVPPAAPAPAPPTSAQAGATTIVAVAPPAAAPGMTLPQFLGLDVVFGGIRTVGQRVRNRLGTRFPGLEAKPPIKSITDPSNLGPDASPAEKAAAEAKMEEDKAPQKAKAINYLASRGCGECYPDTEIAMLAALEDCSEEIRYAAVRGLRSASGDACKSCRENSCCSPKLLKKLYEIAFGEVNGCHIESSSRVRRNARLVICACGGVPPMDDGQAPMEGPTSPGAAPTLAGDITPAVAATPLPSDSSGDATAIENPVAVVGHTTDADSETDASTATAGFLLPESFDPTLESDDDSVRRE
ncbi:hypothetical protein CKO51_20560 [Rhodopirellula sp. SM50]|nr:hypothetical protein [Rhodopirellula sp. SM50]PAY17620.1 hypothetical protein CKO51_20560 [Rhodopirellula sp. SM50]